VLCLTSDCQNLWSVFLQLLNSIVLVQVMEIIHICQNLGLTSLSKLEAQYNHTGTINLHAFSGLTELIILTLSYNHLDYILPATFQDTPNLQSLYLHGNRLKIYPGPILIIPATFFFPCVCACVRARQQHFKILQTCDHCICKETGSRYTQDPF
jgi:Leucine-rich repeat (LRR) protein